MISAILLTVYAVTAGTLGASWLRDALWPSRAPRLAIAAWQSLAVSVLLALASGGLALAVSFPHVNTDLAGVLVLCAETLRHGYASPGGTAAAVLGLAMFLTLAVRAAWCAVHTFAADHRERAARVRALDIVGQCGIVPGALVVEHAMPYAFCIGGRRRRIVLTSGLLKTLGASEVKAVLAHERAHLRQRHYVALSLSNALFATLAPVFPRFREAMAQVRTYAEMCADDSARRHVDARTLRSALVRLACVPAPVGVLAVSAADVERRLRRLDARESSLGRGTAALCAFGIGAALVVPLLLAAGPALAMAWDGVCLIG